MFLKFLDQICPKWIKLDQIGFLTNQKMILKKVDTFTKRIKSFFFVFLIISIQNGWNLIKLDFHQSKIVTIKYCHIYHEDKNGYLIFDFFRIRSVQNGSNLIKLDFSPIKNVTTKSCHIYHEDEYGYFIFDFCGSDLSKMDQTWSNLISQQ